jgi:hypothetical protein
MSVWFRPRLKGHVLCGSCVEQALLLGAYRWVAEEDGVETGMVKIIVRILSEGYAEVIGVKKELSRSIYVRILCILATIEW